MPHGASRQPRALLGDRYELEVLIGEGGMGEVWRARHVALDSLVAIKLLHHASADSEAARRRFTTEARVTAQLKNPHAVQVFDFGITEEGQPYLVMELLEGETVGRRLARMKCLGRVETAALLGQAVKALQRAHALGIVHRDFKPENIVICVDDEGRDHAKVLDFGVAKLVGVLEENAARGGPLSAGSTASFTHTGAILGTPLYMAPEQVRDPAAVDARTDIWALGVVAFECLTGRPPFNGATTAELFECIQSGTHPTASSLEPSLPPGFDGWFDRACALDPAQRFSDAALAFKHLAAALDVATPAPIPAPAPPPTHAPGRVFVVSTGESADPSAMTIQAASPIQRREPAVTPSTGEPLVRARYVKDWLARVGRDEDPWRARFFASLPASTRSTIESVTSGGWLPIDIHVLLADVMLDAYGPARAHEYYRRAFAESLFGGVVGPLTRTGIRLFGMTPVAFLRWAGRAWDASFRNAGTLAGVVLGPGRGRIVYTDLPAVCAGSVAWTGSAQGSAYGVFDVCKVSGVVRIDHSRRHENRLELGLEWTEGRSAADESPGGRHGR